MKSIFEFEELYIHRSFVDMRKGINGLAAIVKEEMGLELKSSSLFVFCNEPRTRMKILYFDHSGFAIWLKRLEDSKFAWPKKYELETISISSKDMALVLDGINIFSRFEEVHFDHLI